MAGNRRKVAVWTDSATPQVGRRGHRILGPQPATSPAHLKKDLRRRRGHAEEILLDRIEPARAELVRREDLALDRHVLRLSLRRLHLVAEEMGERVLDPFP